MSRRKSQMCNIPIVWRNFSSPQNSNLMTREQDGRRGDHMFRFSAHICLVFLVLAAGTVAYSTGNASSTTVPAPAVDATKATNSGQQTAVVAGGCFWGVQAVFQHVKGVISATSGYSGGESRTAEYERVSTGETGHAESVKVVFDPSQVTYGQLLHVFFSVAHDPTELNRQGPDEGTQYRSVVFYNGDEQKRIAEAYITQLEAAKIFPRRIVTQVVSLKSFYPAEAYHQNYAQNHPNNPYIVF